MNRVITYCVDKASGLVGSRVGDELAFPILQFDKIGMGGKGFQPGDFNGPMIYELERDNVFAYRQNWRSLRWTKKIPKRLKNRHRKFWGFKPLPGPKSSDEAWQEKQDQNQ